MSLSAGKVNSQPAVLETGMTPDQSAWAFETQMDNVNKQVKFFMRVQRQGNLSSYGTFDYYFKVQVLRPDGTDVWNTRYGFDENGYQEQVFTLPVFFLERSAERSNPSFGTWKIRLVMDEKESKKEVFVKEYNLNFTNGKVNQPTNNSGTGTSDPFPVIPFTYQKWTLKGWGVGIFDEVSTGSDSYDKEIKVLKSNNTFTVKEVSDSWSQGHRFGVWLTGPPAATYKNSNNNPLYLFGYILRRPNGEADGVNPNNRQNSYCNNPGAVAFPFDLRTPGKYKIEYFLRERDKNAWEESSWIPIGSLEFTITQ
ncbi:MAG: hypothetical protein IPN68_03215 [Bacteroidetes bacterium]|nr:hypothetical protein [Bacteroidota bacterium]